MIIERRWLNRRAIAWVALVLLWLLPLVPLVLMVVDPHFQRINGPVVVIVLWAAYVVVALCLGYGTVASFVNRTTFCLAHERLTVAHGPLYWPGAIDLPRSEITHVFVRERIAEDRGRPYVTGYDVLAETRSGREVVLARRWHAHDQAAYLEHRIDLWLTELQGGARTAHAPRVASWP